MWVFPSENWICLPIDVTTIIWGDFSAELLEASGPDGHLGKGYLRTARACNDEYIFDWAWRMIYGGTGLAGLDGSIGGWLPENWGILGL